MGWRSCQQPVTGIKVQHLSAGNLQPPEGALHGTKMVRTPPSGWRDGDARSYYLAVVGQSRSSVTILQSGVNTDRRESALLYEFIDTDGGRVTIRSARTLGQLFDKRPHQNRDPPSALPTNRALDLQASIPCCLRSRPSQVSSSASRRPWLR